MTLNAKIGGFVDFFGYFRLRDTFQEQIAPKSIEIWTWTNCMYTAGRVHFCRVAGNTV